MMEKTITLNILGMACGGYAATVRQALEAVAGVIAVQVTLEAASAEVRIDPAVASAESLLAAVAAAGYRAECS